MSKKTVFKYIFWILISVTVIIGLSLLIIPSCKRYTPKIPLTIYQTCPSYNDLPLRIREAIKKLKKNNPEFNYKLFEDKDCDKFIIENCTDRECNAYFSINPAYGAMRADFFRYILMYKKGGVYLDIKSGTTCPLLETLRQPIFRDKKYFFLHGPPLPQEMSKEKIIGGKSIKIFKIKSDADLYGELGQWHIITAPKSPFLKKVISNVIVNIEKYRYGTTLVRQQLTFGNVRGKQAVLCLTGPYIYTNSTYEVLEENPSLIMDTAIVRIKSMLGLEYNVAEGEEGEEVGKGPTGYGAAYTKTKHYRYQTESPILGISSVDLDYENQAKLLKDRKVIISMTTTTARIKYPWFERILRYTLTLLGPRTQLQIQLAPNSDHSPNIISDTLINLQSSKFKINIIKEDFGPISNLLCVLLDDSINTDSIIVLCDDDIVYRGDVFYKLVNSVLDNPDAISSMCDKYYRGYAGTAFVKKLLLPILSRKIPTECKFVDDFFMTRFIQESKIPLRIVKYNSQNNNEFIKLEKNPAFCSLIKAATDTHPKWFELENAPDKKSRKLLQKQCAEKL